MKQAESTNGEKSGKKRAAKLPHDDLNKSQHGDIMKP